MSELSEQIRQHANERRRINAELEKGGSRSRQDYCDLQKQFWTSSNLMYGKHRVRKKLL